jgi:hypothetical protein
MDGSNVIVSSDDVQKFIEAVVGRLINTTVIQIDFF